MADPELAPPSGGSLVDYIRANRDRYTRDALTDLLVRSGHSAESVASAWVEADAPTAGSRAGGEAVDHPDLPLRNRTRQSVLSGIAIVLALLALAAGEFGIISASGGRPMMLLYTFLYALQVFLVARWIVRRIGYSYALRRGDMLMTAGWLIIPVIAMAALMGVCIAYGGAFGCVLNCSVGSGA